MTRNEKLDAVYRATHADYKGKINGQRSIMVLRSGGTTIVPLHDLTDKEVEDRLPKKSNQSQ